MNRLIILPPAARFIKKIKDRTLRSRFQEIIHNIIIDPSCGEPKKGDLSGIYCCDFYYNKTNYEVAYTLEEDNDQTIVVILAGTRENFYNILKKYMRNVGH
jgi:mRNA interferase RelE/StbE